MPGKEPRRLGQEQMRGQPKGDSVQNTSRGGTDYGARYERAHPNKKSLGM